MNKLLLGTLTVAAVALFLLAVNGSTVSSVEENRGCSSGPLTLVSNDLSKNPPYLVVQCVDYRVQHVSTHADGLALQLQNGASEICLAGSVLALSDESKMVGDHAQSCKTVWRQTLLEQVRLVLTLHHVKTIKIISHADCGAFQSILGVEEDHTIDHYRVLHEARDLLTTHLKQHGFDDVEIEVFYFQKTGEVTEW